jgi:ankyrin repeat protein
VYLHNEGLAEILKMKVQLRRKDEDTQAALHWRVQHGREAVVRLLLEQDRNELNFKDNDGLTLLL